MSLQNLLGFSFERIKPGPQQAAQLLHARALILRPERDAA